MSISLAGCYCFPPRRNRVGELFLEMMRGKDSITVGGFLFVLLAACSVALIRVEPAGMAMPVVIQLKGIGSNPFKRCTADSDKNRFNTLNARTYPVGAVSEPSIIESVSAVPDFLWSPNHKMTPITLNVVTSGSHPITNTRIVDIRCSDSVNGLDDTGASPDWLAAGGQTPQLNKHYEPGHDRRVYNITVEVIDTLGNKSRKTTTVVVPRSRVG